MNYIKKFNENYVSDINNPENLLVSWYEESNNLGMYGFMVRNRNGMLFKMSSTEFMSKGKAISSGNFWIKRYANGEVEVD
jgi:hypothetical protein